MAHIRQSRPDSGFDFQVKFLETFKVVPFSLGSGVPPSTDAGGAQRRKYNSHSRIRQHAAPRMVLCSQA